MTTINLAEQVQRRELADIARESQIPYARLWRASTGGLIKGLTRLELERLNATLARRQPIAV